MFLGLHLQGIVIPQMASASLPKVSKADLFARHTSEDTLDQRGSQVDHVEARRYRRRRDESGPTDPFIGEICVAALLGYTIPQDFSDVRGIPATPVSPRVDLALKNSLQYEERVKQ